jgi:two-component system response regulator AdeR
MWRYHGYQYIYKNFFMATLPFLEPDLPEGDAVRNGPQALVLVAEDEPEIADILSAYLARAGLRTAHAPDGRAALDQHLMLKPDLVLLDVQMPRLDGWKVLSEIRRRGDTPVIMLTAHDQDIDKLMGLRIGADDYVVKPFNPAEVVARVGAVLRRTAVRSDRQAAGVLRSGPLEIDLETYQVNVLHAGRRTPLALTLTEFRLLAHMARAPRRVFGRAELQAACLPETDSLERTVDSHVSKLRRKLEDAGAPGLPASLRGVGYRLDGAAS